MAKNKKKPHYLDSGSDSSIKALMTISNLLELNTYNDIPIRDRLIKITKDVVKDLNFYKNKSVKDQEKINILTEELRIRSKSSATKTVTSDENNKDYFKSIINTKGIKDASKIDDDTKDKSSKPRLKSQTRRNDSKSLFILNSDKRKRSKSKIREATKSTNKNKSKEETIINMTAKNKNSDTIPLRKDTTNSTVHNFDKNCLSTSKLLHGRNTSGTKNSVTDVMSSGKNSNFSVTHSERERYINEEKIRIKEHIRKLINNEDFDTTIKPIKRSSKEDRDIIKKTHYEYDKGNGICNRLKSTISTYSIHIKMIVGFIIVFVTLYFMSTLDLKF